MRTREYLHTPAFFGRRRQRDPEYENIVGFVAEIYDVLVPGDVSLIAIVLEPAIALIEEDMGTDQVFGGIQHRRGCCQVIGPAIAQVELGSLNACYAATQGSFKIFHLATDICSPIFTDYPYRGQIAIAVIVIDLRPGKRIRHGDDFFTIVEWRILARLWIGE
jgi:hypothetical protein